MQNTTGWPILNFKCKATPHSSLKVDDENKWLKNKTEKANEKEIMDNNQIFLYFMAAIIVGFVTLFLKRKLSDVYAKGVTKLKKSAFMHEIIHRTFSPLLTFRTGESIAASSPAARIMPCDSMPRIVAGSRLVITVTCLPFSSSGS